MAQFSDKIKISLVPLILAVVAAALLLVATMGGSGTPAGGSFRADLQSHQDGSGPPTCRPASKYAGNPHPSDPACKHKPEKHTK